MITCSEGLWFKHDDIREIKLLKGRNSEDSLKPAVKKEVLDVAFNSNSTVVPKYIILKSLIVELKLV